jgi:hypothetical protein
MCCIQSYDPDAQVGALLLTHQVFASLGQFAVDALLLVTALILMDVPCRIVGGNFSECFAFAQLCMWLGNQLVICRGLLVSPTAVTPSLLYVHFLHTADPVNILALMLTKRASIPVGLLRIAAECAGAMAGGRLAVRVVPISLQGWVQMQNV